MKKIVRIKNLLYSEVIFRSYFNENNQIVHQSEGYMVSHKKSSKFLDFLFLKYSGRQTAPTLIAPSFSGIIQNHDHKMLQINCMPDHMHILFGMRPTQSLSDLVQIVTGKSSKWINHRDFTKSRFSWQQGFGAFSYSKSQVPNVINYIRRQEQHHKEQPLY